MANTSKRTPEEIEQMLSSYKQSGLTRRQYCAEKGIKISTFDYYRLRRLKKDQPNGTHSSTKLVKVKVESAAAADNKQQPPRSFTLILSNGRRIECGWNYVEQNLAKLIRLAEAV